MDCLSDLITWSTATADLQGGDCAARPDVITSDVQLACGCGIDAVRRICDGKPIPVLYITGTAMLVRERRKAATKMAYECVLAVEGCLGFQSAISKLDVTPLLGPTPSLARQQRLWTEARVRLWPQKND